MGEKPLELDQPHKRLAMGLRYGIMESQADLQLISARMTASGGLFGNPGMDPNKASDMLDKLYDMAQACLPYRGKDFDTGDTKSREIDALVAKYKAFRARSIRATPDIPAAPLKPLPARKHKQA